MNETNDVFAKRKQFARRNFYTLKDSGLVYILALIFPLIVGLVFGYVGMAIASNLGVEFAEGSSIITELFNRYLWFSIPYMLLTQVVFLALWLVYHQTAKIKYSACGVNFKKINPLTAILCALVGMICVAGFVWLIEGCFGAMFDKIGANGPSLSLPNNTWWWLLINLVILGVVPAIVEELLFRGIIFQGLRRKFSATSAVLLTALLFALMHQSITQFIYPLLLGIVLCVVMEKTGNLIYPMLIHLFNNLSTLTADFLAQKGYIPSVTNKYGQMVVAFPTTWWGVICAILLAVATCGLLFLLYKFYLSKHKKLQKEEVAGQNPVAEPTMIGKLPLTLICGIILAVFMIILNVIG